MSVKIRKVEPLLLIQVAPSIFSKGEDLWSTNRYYYEEVEKKALLPLNSWGNVAFAKSIQACLNAYLGKYELFLPIKS